MLKVNGSPLKTKFLRGSVMWSAYRKLRKKTLIFFSSSSSAPYLLTVKALSPLLVLLGAF